MVFAIVFLILSVDQISKFLITKNLLLYQSIPIIKGFFHFTLIHNRGAAFGILKNQACFFIIISIVAILLISSSLFNHQRHKRVSYHTISLGLILSGAVGNLIDRACFGYVIDFLDFRIWPVFNVADSAITIGAVLLAWSILKSGKNKSGHQVIKSQCHPLSQSYR